MFSVAAIAQNRSDVSANPGADAVAFEKHVLTQMYAYDVDGDGLTDIVVGKRRWAHGPNKDIEPGAAPVLYWFRLERRPDSVHFRPHRVDDWSGVGVQVVAVDVTGDRIPDILTASKLGSMLFITKRGGH
jgi:hypothetical protein